MRELTPREAELLQLLKKYRQQVVNDLHRE
jgi:hypothetical protein